MKAAKILLILVIVISIFSFSLFACDWVDGNGDRGPGGKSILGTPQPGSAQAYDLTATYGADQFNAQLTAIVNSQVVGSSTGNP
jgi:hypothetical protein